MFKQFVRVGVGAAVVGAVLVVALHTPSARGSPNDDPVKPNAPAWAPNPVASGLTVLTYNTHLFKDSCAELGAAVAHRRIVFDDDVRAEKIAEKLEGSGADIVALQEVWAYERQDWFVKRLQKAYPHSYRVPYAGGRDWKKAMNFLEALAKLKFEEDELMKGMEFIKNSSGLVLLSKYPLKDVKFWPFADRAISFKDEDSLANKGVITATVEPWSGGPTFRVGISHASVDTGRNKEQPDVRVIAAKTTAGHPGPAIMMGDFNVHHDREVLKGEQETLQRIFKDVGAVDAYLAVPGMKFDKDAYTYSARSGEDSPRPGENSLSRVFRTGHSDGDRLDYVFVKPSGGGLTLTPKAAEVLRDWNYSYKSGWSHDFADKWDKDYVAVQSFQLKGHPYLLGFAKGDHAYIRRINDDGRGWAEGEKAFGRKWDTNYVPAAVTTFHLKGHPYFFVLKGKELFRERDKAAIYRINDDAKGWQLAWDGKWDSDYVAVRSFEIKGHPYLFCLAENDRAYIRRINDDGKGWTQTYAGKWDKDYVGTAITGFELQGRSYIFALSKKHNAVVRRIKDDGTGWEDVHSDKWGNRDCVAVQSFVLDGRPHLFCLQDNHTALIRRIKDGGVGWETVFEGRWSSACVGPAVTTFTLNGQPHVFTLQPPDTSRMTSKGAAVVGRVARALASGGPDRAAKEVEAILASEDWVDVLRDADSSIRVTSEGWITRLQEPEVVKMDLSDHYPVQVTFGVTKGPAPAK